MNRKVFECTKGRSSNFTKDETQRLVNLIEKYMIITSTKTDNASVYKKEMAWKNVVEEFNEGATTYRTRKQLQHKFENLKKRSRRDRKEKTTEQHKADPSRSPKVFSPIEWLTAITKESISGRLSADDDSDYILEFRPNSRASTGSYSIEKKDNKVDSASPREETYEFINDQCDSTPMSEESDTTKKRVFSFINNIERKYMHQSDKEPHMIDTSNCKESHINMFLEEEHKQKLRHKQELHEIELEYKRNLYKLSLEKMKIEIEIEKQKLKSILT